MDRGHVLTEAGLDTLMPEPDEDIGVAYGPLTGIWPSAYSYPSSSRSKGAVYDGTIQMEINQAGDRMKGKWLGFGRDPGEINDGPWQFTRVDTYYSRESRKKWDHTPPEPE